MNDLEMTTVPRGLYFHEVAYSRSLEAEIERLRKDNEMLKATIDRFLRIEAEGWTSPDKPFPTMES